MKNGHAIRERYLRDSLPVRLGGRASDLSRIKPTYSLSVRLRHIEMMLGLVALSGS